MGILPTAHVSVAPSHSSIAWSARYSTHERSAGLHENPDETLRNTGSDGCVLGCRHSGTRPWALTTAGMVSGHGARGIVVVSWTLPLTLGAATRHHCCGEPFSEFVPACTRRAPGQGREGTCCQSSGGSGHACGSPRCLGAAAGRARLGIYPPVPLAGPPAQRRRSHRAPTGSHQYEGLSGSVGVALRALPLPPGPTMPSPWFLAAYFSSGSRRSTSPSAFPSAALVTMCDSAPRGPKKRVRRRECAVKTW